MTRPISRTFSQWHVNQAQSSVRMLERMIGEDLRRGETAQARRRLHRVEEILGQQILKVQDTAPLMLLAARLAEVVCDYRKTDLYIGRVLAAEWLLRGEIKFAIDRFCVRLALNRGETADARYLVDRIERMVTLVPTGHNSQHHEIIDRDDEQVSAVTWMLSAEVSLIETDYARAEADLARARGKFAPLPPTHDEAVHYELLTALAELHRDAGVGARMLAYLYHTHLDEKQEAGPPLEAQTLARLAAACGRTELAAGVSDREAERWSGLGAPAAAHLEKFLADPSLLEENSDLLPEPELLLGLLEESFGSHTPADVISPSEDETPPRQTVALSPDPEANAEEEEEASAIRASDFPLEFGLEHTRLDSITSMLDLDRDTGVLEVDWSRCDADLLTEAADGGAISRFATLAPRAFIHFNEGAYVDAAFESDDPALRSLAPVEVIFELFRIAMARLPRSRARQIVDDPGAAHFPERINQRPNNLNLEISARIDNLRGRTVDDADEAGAAAAATAADWDWGIAPIVDLPTVSAELSSEEATRRSEQQTHLVAETSSPSPQAMSAALSAVFGATTLVDLCAAAHRAVVGAGGVELAGVMISAPDEGGRHPLASCGADVESFAAHVERGAGPLIIRLGAAHLSDEERAVVSTILDAAAHRLRTIPGADYRGQIEDAHFIAADANTQKLLRLIREFAALDGTGRRRKLQHIMIVGERGVGKELVAQLLHRWSGRADKQFRAINMGRINPELAAAEIFGARKGGYTGATADRPGLIQQFAGGTLFLDEIDEADDKVQAMLKRVVEYGTYERIGDPSELRADVRFVVATNRVGGELRSIKEDLRDRFWEIRVPPLRERRADIRPLAEHFAHYHDYELPEPVLAWLESPALAWPGNVRQLQNTVERACTLASDASDLTLDFFRQCQIDANPARDDRSGGGIDHSAAPLRDGETLESRLQKIEKALIEHALVASGNNKTQAAERLGGTRQWLYKRCQALGIKTN